MLDKRGTGIAQSVYRLATGCRAEFVSLRGQDFSLFHVVQTGSGAHQASCSMCARGSFPGDKVAGA
jgi:hypothetical protein